MTERVKGRWYPPEPVEPRDLTAEEAWEELREAIRVATMLRTESVTIQAPLARRLLVLLDGINGPSEPVAAALRPRYLTRRRFPLPPPTTPPEARADLTCGIDGCDFTVEHGEGRTMALHQSEDHQPTPPEPVEARDLTRGEHCRDCGRTYGLMGWWRAPDTLWERVTGHRYGEGLLCPDCFGKRAEERRIYLRWSVEEDR